MTTLIIPQKQSNSGSIHDLASYYGSKGYTTHKTEKGAIERKMKLRKEQYSSQIIDAAGNYYDILHDKLVMIGGSCNSQ